MADEFSLTIWRVPGAKTSGKMSGKMSGKIGPKIVALMLQNPTVTIPDLAKALKRTERTIERLINQLKSDEIIGRVGPAKGGRWEVFE